MKQEGFDIFGVPLHGWTKENFKNIAKLKVNLFAWSIYRRKIGQYIEELNFSNP